MIAVRRVAANMKTYMILQCLEMPRVRRGVLRFVKLVVHSDGKASSSVRFTERLEEIGASPSIGTVVASFDNALAETVNGLYKTECVYGPDARGWDDVNHLEQDSLGWMEWYNHERLHGYLDDIPPVEFEESYNAKQTDQLLVGIK